MARPRLCGSTRSSCDRHLICPQTAALSKADAQPEGGGAGDELAQIARMHQNLVHEHGAGHLSGGREGTSPQPAAHSQRREASNCTVDLELEEQTILILFFPYPTDLFPDPGDVREKVMLKVEEKCVGAAKVNNRWPV
jgi:hypothetical protein